MARSPRINTNPFRVLTPCRHNADIRKCTDPTCGFCLDPQACTENKPCEECAYWMARAR